ncbi:part of small (ribosomal) subunit (SSU) processosome (contains U3 snoRNA) [Scheffersomyces stipitis CBS 6054]|uniref:Part of small (Ribosomal) subunit (SSU) processosome (Contains U3 snoRNA) n=1 Tax=Scheffersomyces stipitis (strain ATCC 58785 / CBS 6054 / NBRC 10063 / NRRL Y-11545) TaxID=322104 RepID=A3GI81_PICST|nr:U3 small nucleolar RNA-associated protein 5 [Scheffersomyces stipitis CBS 6054]EAZ63187.2 part of small (ribosomal) subunit (SSU) processosome (contains U3 snoRNA) [Scheffersomyces stipitis CBS 6054]KAG2735714.1 hypothetical protein G9P44_001928 [Scheffersomyces stipitis]
MSSVIVSRFDPSRTYLATASVALDAHQISVQSVQWSQTAVNTVFKLDKTSRVTNLKWIPSGNGNDFYIAVTLTRGSVLIYSPESNAVVAELATSNNSAILDFYFSPHTHTAWSCDLGGSVQEWDLSSFQLLQQFKITDFVENVESINRIASVSYGGSAHLLVGSHSIYLVDIASKALVKTYPGHVEPLNSLVPISSDADLFLTSAKGDRFINMYSVERAVTKTVFVTQAPVVDIFVGTKDNKSVLVVINENGNIELFNNPLSTEAPSQPATPLSKKKRRQQLVSVQSRSPQATIRLSRPQSEIKSHQDANLVIDSVTISDNSVIISWLENSNISYFETLQWLDESGNFPFVSDRTIHKSKPDLKVTTHSSHGHDVASAKLYSEGHAIISDGTNVRDLELNIEDDKEEETLADKLEKLGGEQKAPAKSIKTKHKLGGDKTGTLTIILSQSLRNNDHSLLETVLSNRDPVVIQNTISKLDPSLAVVLLDRLSERFQRQSSRFDQLNYWLKWIVIIHGAVISSLPNLSIKLSGLHSMLTKKADTLPRLLELQGRLHMLYDQNDLRKEIMSEELRDEDEEIDSDIEYIEEIDDAEVLGLLNDDDFDMVEGRDDYVDSDEDDDEEVDDDEEDDEEEEEEGIKSALDLDDENASDVEIGVNNNDRMEDDE